MAPPPQEYTPTSPRRRAKPRQPGCVASQVGPNADLRAALAVSVGCGSRWYGDRTMELREGWRTSALVVRVGAAGGCKGCQEMPPLALPAAWEPKPLRGDAAPITTQGMACLAKD